ncbi:unnamed protein product, partial [marine sediment metagenome]
KKNTHTPMIQPLQICQKYASLKGVERLKFVESGYSPNSGIRPGLLAALPQIILYETNQHILEQLFNIAGKQPTLNLQQLPPPTDVFAAAKLFKIMMLTQNLDAASALCSATRPEMIVVGFAKIAAAMLSENAGVAQMELGRLVFYDLTDFTPIDCISCESYDLIHVLYPFVRWGLGYRNCPKFDVNGAKQIAALMGEYQCDARIKPLMVALYYVCVSGMVLDNEKCYFSPNSHTALLEQCCIIPGARAAMVVLVKGMNPQQCPLISC